MKKVLAFLICVSCSTMAFADETELTTQVSESNVKEEFVPNLGAGNIEIGGGAGFGYSSSSGSDVALYPRLVYYFTDRLGLGASFLWQHSSGYRALGVGPILNYYFYKDGRFAAYGNQSAFYRRYDNIGMETAYTSWTGATGVGFNYFITPSVAFGPQLSYNYDLENRPYSSSYGQLQFQFSIHL